MIPKPIAHAIHPSTHLRATNNDVVDRDENQLDSVANEAHDSKADCACHSNLLELLCIWLCASLDQSSRIVAELNCALDTITHRVALVVEEWHGCQCCCHNGRVEAPCSCVG